MKGLLNTEIMAISPVNDVHSRLSPLIDNSLWTLNSAFDTIWDNARGKILIKDWHREAENLNADDLYFISKEEFYENNFKKKYGIVKPRNDLKGIEIKKALASEPTCNISYMSTGVLSTHSRAVIPSKTCYNRF
jgi:hypothetical protein